MQIQFWQIQVSRHKLARNLQILAGSSSAVLISQIFPPFPNSPVTNFPNYTANIWARVRSVNFTIHNFSSHSWPLSVKHLQGYLPPTLPSGHYIGVTTADLMTSGSKLVKNWAPSNTLCKLRTFAKIRWNWKFFWTSGLLIIRNLGIIQVLRDQGWGRGG